MNITFYTCLNPDSFKTCSVLPTSRRVSRFWAAASRWSEQLTSWRVEKIQAAATVNLELVFAVNDHLWQVHVGWSGSSAAQNTGRRRVIESDTITFWSGLRHVRTRALLNPPKRSTTGEDEFTRPARVSYSVGVAAATMEEWIHSTSPRRSTSCLSYWLNLKEFLTSPRKEMKECVRTSLCVCVCVYLCVFWIWESISIGSSTNTMWAFRFGHLSTAERCQGKAATFTGGESRSVYMYFGPFLNILHRDDVCE